LAVVGLHGVTRNPYYFKLLRALFECNCELTICYKNKMAILVRYVLLVETCGAVTE